MNSESRILYKERCCDRVEMDTTSKIYICSSLIILGVTPSRSSFEKVNHSY